MKKLLAIFLTTLLLLTACGGEADSPSKSNPFSDSDVTKSASSTIFGRSISYDAFTPAEGLSLPVSSSEISDVVQIEKKLFILADGSVYSVDIESGETKKLFDTSGTLFTSYEDKLYTYSHSNGVITEYDGEGNILKEYTLDLGDVDDVTRFWMTDDYYLLRCTSASKVYIYSRETLEQTLTQKTPLTGIELYPYKGNSLISVTTDNTFSDTHLGIFDATNGKTKEFQNIGRDYGYYPAVAYCTKTDTVLVFGGDTYSNEKTTTTCRLTEFSMSDSDYMMQNRYYLNASYDTKYFLGVCENIVTAISTDSELITFDYLDPPESITLLGVVSLDVSDMIYEFEKETGILVKLAYTDYDKLVLKLMAGDSDFDIYNTGGGYHNYVNAGTFVDLKEIESLNSRISSNSAADFAVSYNGKYFGVPSGICEVWTSEEYFPENGTSSSYSLIVSENIYYAKYIDIAEKHYFDPDGKELYKLLKYINDNRTGNRGAMPFGDDTKIFGLSAYLLNPKSENRDNAVKFLECIFDTNEKNGGYPELNSTENCYVEWRCRPTDAISPIFEARNKILLSNDGYSSSDLKKLAKEAAAEVAMRIGE